MAAWIAGAVAVVAPTIAFGLEKVAKRKHEIMEHRKQALLLALEVVDHVLANSKMGDLPPSNPHEWDIGKARTAMNQMIIYCHDPKRTLAAFNAAIGTHNPSVGEKVRLFGPKQLDEFRQVICKELQLRNSNYTDDVNTWIYSLPGATPKLPNKL